MVSKGRTHLRRAAEVVAVAQSDGVAQKMHVTGLGLEEALDLAEQFGRTHPSDRMRLAGWEALAMVADGAVARDQVWARAEAGGNRMIAGEARRQRVALTPERGEDTKTCELAR